ncbi:hypothetical protein HPB51_016921 [Rhipicephalus microplus]|uniref:Uncharacterized protein n=1 Tax=Rhipicephalus microplus TaxID=6941 RepID=A0A9J6E2E6_RHIMP|nr:hypothetical protein HPB51_016921 [Rhipicephalus microplus]
MHACRRFLQERDNVNRLNCITDECVWRKKERLSETRRVHSLCLEWPSEEEDDEKQQRRERSSRREQTLQPRARKKKNESKCGIASCLETAYTHVYTHARTRYDKMAMTICRRVPDGRHDSSTPKKIAPNNAVLQTLEEAAETGSPLSANM